MRHAIKRIGHIGREYLTHWMVAGLIVAATGVAPDHWMAHVVHELHVPADALHLWAAGIDLRWVLLLAGLALIVGDIAWRRIRPPVVTLSVPATTVERASRPDRPSIAVLPFSNLGGDPKEEYFSDGVADDIITELSRTHWLLVIARNSSFAYKGQAVDVKRIERELDVRYILEGSVLRGGGRIRVSAHLVDAGTGAQIWTERYDRNLADLFVVQDEITVAVTRAIAPAVADAEQKRALRKLPGNLGAWEAYQRGLWHLSQKRLADVPLVREFFNRALELDRTLGAAHSGLSALYAAEGAFFASRPLVEALTLQADEARKAVELDPTDADAHARRAFGSNNIGDYAGGFEHVERALSINPSCALAYRAKGWLLVSSGQPAEGRDALLFNMRLDPFSASDPALRSVIAMSYYLEGDYENAIVSARRLIADRPDHPFAYRWLAAALGQLGRRDEARTALGKALAVAPDAFHLYVRQRVPWVRPEDYDHMLSGLRKAGWDEGGGCSVA